MDDLRFAVRRLSRRPGATLASIATLGCAIGAAVATWSVLSALLLRPVPVPDPGRIVVVGMRFGTRVANDGVFPIHEQVAATRVFEAVAAGGKTGMLPVGSSGPLSVYFATSNFLDVLGLRPETGRWFLSTEDRRGAASVAVLSDRFWRRQFEARPQVIGDRIVVNGHAIPVIGIAPRGFRGVDLTDAPDVYLPLQSIADVIGPGHNLFSDKAENGFSPTGWVRTFGRLKPGMSRPDALAGLSALLPPRANVRQQVVLTDLETASLAEGARPPLEQFSRLVAVTVGLLLVIGCLAAGMQLLMRTEARRAEFAMCLAMGATRTRLASGVLIEGAVLSIAGAALAVPASTWLVATLTSFRLPGGINLGQLEVAVDGRTLAAAALAALGATVAMALVAGGFSFSADVADALRARAGSTPRIGRQRTRALLVIAQVAVALVLLVGAGLFFRSLSAALSLNPAYDTSRIAVADVRPPNRAAAPDVAAAFFDDLSERLRLIPSVRSVSMGDSAGGMSAGGQWTMDGESRTMPSFLAFEGIDSNYFSTVGLSVAHGRSFTRDDGASAPPVGIVSESFGRFLARGGDPIGHRVERFGGRRMGDPPVQIEIVGVVPDIITNVRVLEPLVMYVPVGQMPASPFPSRVVTLHTLGDPSIAMRQAARVIHERSPADAIPAFATIDDQIARQMSPQRFGATVMGALGLIAAVLTLFGIFVLVESMASLRRREIGIRAALGATGPQLGALILGETLWLVGAGVSLGLLLAWLGVSLIRAFLFHVQPFDAATIATVTLGIGLLALVVSARPALRATRVDLAGLLREE
jgi:putative ABC transport system permease protein